MNEAAPPTDTAAAATADAAATPTAAASAATKARSKQRPRLLAEERREAAACRRRADAAAARAELPTLPPRGLTLPTRARAFRRAETTWIDLLLSCDLSMTQGTARSDGRFILRPVAGGGHKAEVVGALLGSEVVASERPPALR